MLFGLTYAWLGANDVAGLDHCRRNIGIGQLCRVDAVGTASLGGI